MLKLQEKINEQKLINTIISMGTTILFIAAIIVLSVLSFVKSFKISPNIRNITTLALISAVFNWLIWDSYYKKQYEKVLLSDINNKDYCIHKRYYNARKGWKYYDLQDKIRNYNEDFKEAWLRDCEDITGYTREQLKELSYKKQPHKLIIWKIKHGYYPKTGIKTPNDVLYILSVGKSDSMKIRTKAEEHYHLSGRISKFVMLALGSLLVASLTYEFIKGDWFQALVTLVLNISMLFLSLFFGSSSGIQGGKLKLDTAEIICERLEEWKNEDPSEEPYQDSKNDEVKSKDNLNVNTPTIQIG